MSRILLGLAALLALQAPARAEVGFPAGFWWGAATAAHQVEGQSPNDWREFEARPGTIQGGDRSDLAVDHYRRFEADFALAAEMRHNAHRMSIEWARLEPEPGRFDPEAIRHYHAVFAAMKRHGLAPIVTLHHFTNPPWFAGQGGFAAPGSPEAFARFARFAGREFGSEVDAWITVNEPNVYAFQSYEAGTWPPGHQNREEALSVLASLARAHAAAYRALHESDRQDADGDGQDARVGVAQHLALFDPHTAWNPVDWANAAFSDRVFNHSFLKAVTSGELDFWAPGSRGVVGWAPELAGTLDFIGVNYYTRWRCTSFGPQARMATSGAPVNDLGWEIYPEGLGRALRLADGYTRLPGGRRIPIVVTENGIDDRRGDRRAAYLVRHVMEVERAIRSGIDVRGYLHWTLMDNFEWAEGYAPRFGLYRIDREHDLARVPTEAVAVFRAIAGSNGIPPEMAERYGR